MSGQVWTVDMIATATGISPSTIRSYVSRGQMPAPTGHLGRTPYWDAAHIVPWLNHRNDSVQRDVVPGASKPTKKKGTK